MPAPRPPRRRVRLAALVSAVLAVSGFQLLLAPQAQAVSGTVVISEVFGANGNLYNQDYVELHNIGAGPVDLTGMSVQYRAATSGTGASSGVNLTGSLPAGGYYLVGGASSATGTAIPTPDAANTSMNMSGTNGVVILANTTTSNLLTNAQIGDGPSIVGTPGTNALIQDLVGYGTTPDRYETARAPQPGNTSVIQRTAGDTDDNSADFATSATGDPTNLGGSSLPLSLATISNQNAAVGTPVNIDFVSNASGGTPPYTWSATGLPTGLGMDAAGAVTGTPTVADDFNVEVTVEDSAAPTHATASKTFTWHVSAPLSVTPIAQIQGTGSSSPLVGELVSTQGVVTASYPTGGLNGFYIQTPGPDTANASDAIFVFGGAGFSNYPTIGASVSVTGTVTEFNGLTELVVDNGGVSTIADLPGSVTPKTQIPQTNCAVGACPSTAALNDAREPVEGELFKPTAAWTATDVYDGGPAYNDGTNSSQNFGEIGVAADRNKPLVAPTEVVDAQKTNAVNQRIAYNNAHRIILDDGSSTNYSSATGQPFPWMSSSYVPRVGAAVTFPGPVVLTWGFNQWRIEPTTQVVGAPTAGQPQFSQTRAANAAPVNVGGQIKLATFNVLNFFPTTGEEFAGGAGHTCTYFNDRQGNPITVNSCNPNGPRGAANAANLQRQRDKIVAAINTANADIVSLEELENSVQFGKPRDFAISALVDALNADAGAGTWAFVPSPATLPPTAQQDVIRTGFIYKPAKVETVGTSVVLSSESGTGGAFEDAREPLAQAFRQAGGSASDTFAVIVNHFKSKGSGTPDPNGQGNANDRRVLQAKSLLTFANSFKAARGTDKVFLVGDFNAYSKEDPIQVLEDGGYTNLDSTSDQSEESYNFDGFVGSLDHVLANAAAHEMVTGVDVWPINAYESVYYEYSRFNYNVTNLYDAGPFRSSDHNPEIVGLNVTEPSTRTIQILGTNDFHGRLQRETGSPTAGAAVLSGAVKQLRGQNPDTVFAAAGDLIGASTFESFIAHDKPTIDALNEAGLDVSSVGNHEFDQGYNDLVNRVMAPYNATTNPDGGAGWQYLGANVRFRSSNNPALPRTWTKSFGSVKVGFVGAVTEHLPELVSPGGIADIKVTDIVDEVNTAADNLKANGADIVVMLVHEGAPMTNCNQIGNLGPDTDFGSIITGVNDNVDAIVSGHTHLAYNCRFAVPGWDGRPVTQRPVVSAGQYGMALNQLDFTVDTATGQIESSDQHLLNLQDCGATCTTSAPVYVPNYPADPDTESIVADAVANAAVLGAVKLGNLGGPFFRGKVADGTTENRGAESTLGNLVAEVQKWATRNPESGSAQIAFMNPGGLRQDMTGTGSGAFPRDLTYQQAAVVQPFANTLVNMGLTGAQIKTVLEQQWQPAGASRPFLKLGISKGFTYTFDDSKPVGSRITGMWLNGTPINPATEYSVTVNSFLATGGDSFFELNNGAHKQDTGQTDLQAMVAFMAEFASGASQVAPSYVQNGVGVKFPAGAPASYAPGDHVKFDVSSWSMTNALDVKDSVVTVKLGSATLGTATLDNAPQAALPGFDTVGKASVDVVLPAGTPGGATSLTLVGTDTGTSITVPITVSGGGGGQPTKVASTTTGKVKPAKPKVGQKVKLKVSVTGANGVAVTGQVTITVKGEDAITVDLVNGKATVNLGKFNKKGKKKVTIDYSGSTTLLPSSETLTFKVRAR
ncbi:MAG TPA: ExeM/NucH family extracellular endonuclease [Nocardioides sp.]|uniref:ExeM/NucH family extracellular endonuclease n=1 Tax=Nocardioides sp. TaxID=35761 RepID=UPI002E30BBFB|nr:ExeM/NucH family extracellular endonuclease [Nocardioides sp.]HEX5090102.1 ExeM/NucH family extracellular endonuclease [Nocardioides sp.]